MQRARMAFLLAQVTAVEDGKASKLTGRNSFEVGGLVYLVLRRRVPRTTCMETRSNLPFLSEQINDRLPHANISHQRRIADDEKPMLGSTAGHIDPIRGLEKANLLVRIASYGAKNDDFGLLSLEIINCSETEHGGHLESCLALRFFSVRNIPVISRQCTHSIQYVFVFLAKPDRAGRAQTLIKSR